MKKIYSFIIILLLMFIPKVNACVLTYEEFSDTNLKMSMVVGEYVFDIYEGYSPNLEDIAIASRTIPSEQDEYVYTIANNGAYFLLDLISEYYSDNVAEFPLLDVTYQYRDNIRGASDDDYDLFTCQVDWINVDFTILETTGENEYKTSATRTVNITSGNGIGEVKYCLGEGICTPDTVGTVESGLMKVNYETALGGQTLCVEAKDTNGNVSGVVCDDTYVKVDAAEVKISATEELGKIVEKAPHTLEELFDIEFSVSGGNLTYYYYTGSEASGDRTKHLLTNLADLPSGEIEVEIRAIGGNGLVTRENRIINVVKNVVTYDYETNGGTSTDIETFETVYKGKARLTEKAYKDGYEFIGWNTDKDAKIGLDTVEVTEDLTLYALFKKEITADFEIISRTGAVPATSEYQSFACEIYNNEESCKAIVPKISARVGYVVKGWTDQAYGIEPKYQGGEEIDLSKDATFYSITHDKTATTATFTVLEDEKIVQKVASCYKYNGDETCEIDKTSITSDDYNGMKLEGFTESFDDVEPVDSFVITSGKRYYAYYANLYDINYISGEGIKETDQTGVYFILDITGAKQNVESVIVPDAKTLTGYEFIGYKTGTENGKIEILPGDELIVEASQTYYAIYEKDVTLSYSTTDDDVTGIPKPVTGKMYYLSSKKAEEGLDVKLDDASTITKINSVFKSWNNDNKEYDAGEEITIYEDIVMTPDWVVDGCRVIFNYWENGGVSATKASMTYYRLGDPLNVTTVTARKPGWEFIGWSTNKGATAGALGSSYVPTSSGEDVELYAMFRKTITINFVSQDSEVFSTDTTPISGVLYNNDDDFAVTMRKVTVRDAYVGNYKFIKWSKDKNDTDLTNTGYASGDEIYVSDNTTFYTITKNLTPLIARFNYLESERTIYKETNCTKYNGSSTCIITPPEIESEYNGGVLTGFSSESGMIDEVTNYTISGDENYYGIYDRVLSVIYHSGVLSGNTSTNLINMQYLTGKNGAVEFKANINLEALDGIAGYTNLGWRKDTQSLAPTYYAGDNLSINEDQEFYGVYERQITLSYAAMGGDTTPANQTNILIYNTVEDTDTVTSEFKLADALSRTGYRFIGWDEGNTGVVHDAGSTIELNKNTKMYAVWDGKPFTVTYDCATNGGSECSVTTEEKDTVYLNQIDLTPVATKEGWEFVGWSETPNTKTTLTEKEMPSENITLYAVFRQMIKANWIVIDEQAGTLETDLTSCYKYNNETECRIDTGNIIAKDGYTASGWTTEQGSINVEVGNNSTTMVEKENIYYSITRLSDPLEGVFYYGTEEGTIGTVKSNCQLYNGATGCTITEPLVPTEYNSALFSSWTGSPTEVTETTFDLTTDTIYYSHYVKPINVIYHDGETDSITTDSKTVEYILSDSGDNEIIPTFTIRRPTAINTYTTLGWTEDAISHGSVTEPGGRDLELDYTLELYGRYEREISLIYNANGGTPTPATEKVVQAYHSLLGATVHTFKAANEITQTGATFEGWGIGSDTAEPNLPGEDITITQTTTLVAIWNWKTIPTLTVSKSSVNTVYNTQTATNTINYNGDGTLSVQSANSSIATATVSGKTVTIKPGSKNGTTTITVNASEGETYQKKSVTFTVVNKIYPSLKITNTAINNKTITLTYSYNGDGTISAVSSNTKLATIDKVDTNAKTVTVTALTVGQVKITINSSAGTVYGAASVSKDFTFGSVASSNSTAFQEALTTWGTIGTSTNQNWYGSTNDSKIYSPDGSYVILESVNTNNFTGYYFKEKQADGTYAVPSYEDITIDFDMTANDGDDDAMGAMIRFKPETTANYWTGYMLFLDNGGVGNGAYNGIWRANNKQFSTTLYGSSGGTLLDNDKTIFWARYKWQHYRIQALGDTITIWRWDTNTTGEYESTDDAIIFQYTDTSAEAVKSGTYGFWCYSQPYTQFKNFTAITGDPDNFEITVN